MWRRGTRRQEKQYAEVQIIGWPRPEQWNLHHNVLCTRTRIVRCVRTCHYKNLTKEGKSQVASESRILASLLLHFLHLPLITSTAESHYSNPFYPPWVPHGRMENFIFPQANFHYKVLVLGWVVPVFPAEESRRSCFLVNTCYVEDTPANRLFELGGVFFSSFSCRTYSVSRSALYDIQTCVVQPWSPLESAVFKVIHGYRCAESLPLTFLSNFPIPNKSGYKTQTNAD